MFEHVSDKTIQFAKIDTKDQLADGFTKQLTRQNFEEWRSKLMTATGTWSSDQVPKLIHDYVYEDWSHYNLSIKRKAQAIPMCYSHSGMFMAEPRVSRNSCRYFVTDDYPWQFTKAYKDERKDITHSIAWSLSQSRIASFALDEWPLCWPVVSAIFFSMECTSSLL